MSRDVSHAGESTSDTMTEDQLRITRAIGVLLGREETFMDDVRREIRWEVATAIREELAVQLQGNSKEGWERLERILGQQAQEEKRWRMEVDRKLEAMEQAIRVVTTGIGSASLKRGEEGGQVVERPSKRARATMESEGRVNLQGPQRAPTTPELVGPAQSQHAPKEPQEQGHEQPAVNKEQARPKPVVTKNEKASDAPIPGLGAVTKPQPTWADMAGRPAPTKAPSADGFMMVGKTKRLAEGHPYTAYQDVRLCPTHSLQHQNPNRSSRSRSFSSSLSKSPPAVSQRSVPSPPPSRLTVVAPSDRPSVSVFGRPVLFFSHHLVQVFDADK
jgi:hypothetical protein